MSRNAIIDQILALRRQFNELIPGRTPGDVYHTLAEENYEDAHTIALKIACTGYYRIYANDVRKAEKERFVKA